MKKPVVFLVGPTATGKSEIAVKLARKIKAEIISCDSMQVYKEMDIGTSKPSTALRQKVPHYLIDEVSPNKEFNVAIFRNKVNSLIKKIHKKGKIPLLVGGSGLYMKVLLDGIFEEDEDDKAIRKTLLEEAKDKPNDYLYKKLKKIDSQTATLLHPNDRRRIIRALEVYYKLGMPISVAKKRIEGIYRKYKVLIFGLMRKRDKLYERINKRVDIMFKKGLLSEVKKLVKKYNLSKTAKCALGYKEVLGFLNGEYKLDEAKRLTKRNTRRFAKRQIAWFKKESRIEWFMITDKDRDLAIVNKLYKRIRDEI